MGAPKGHQKYGKAGRPKGSVNKATADIRALAQKHGPDAIATLIEIMQNRIDTPAAQIAAAKELLDRGYGKSTQPIAGDLNGPPVKTEVTWVWPGS
jgi:hypothetical protein